MTESRIFVVYIGPMGNRGGPDTGWRLVPVPRHRAPCEHSDTAIRIAGMLVGGMSNRLSPYDWVPDREPRDFAFIYREVIRDRWDTPAYVCDVRWTVDEVHRDDDCVKHGPVLVKCTRPVPVGNDAAVAAPIVRAP